MEKEKKMTSIRVKFSPLVLLVGLLIVLRLDGVIDWPWVLVLAPIWGALILVGVLGLPISALDRPKR